MSPIRRCLIAGTFAALAVAASDSLSQTNQKDALKAATDRLNAIKGATGAKPVATEQTPSGDPCTVVSLATVKSVLPRVKAAERSRRLEADFGTTECQFNDGAGNVLLIVQESYDDGAKAKDDAVGIAEAAQGMRATKGIRPETFPSVGVDNAAVVEVTDAARGIRSPVAYLALRKGRHGVTLNAPGLLALDRPQALKGFEALAQQAASRL